MEYQEFVTSTNNLMVAGEIIASLQRGDEGKEALMHTVLTKTYPLSDGRQGDILCLAIELQKYIAALQIDKYNTYSNREDVEASLNKSLEHFNGEEDLERLIDSTQGDPRYERIIIEKQANIQALDKLKEKYLGIERVR